MKGWRGFFAARGGSGFFCGNPKKLPNCLDKKVRARIKAKLMNSRS
jgi:hypothetical protein